ncbi:MAG: hypothetical protein IJK23_09780 [Clostridia bacterium]|nr:hypothetical protein [Clostridia bacterium]
MDINLGIITIETDEYQALIERQQILFMLVNDFMDHASASLSSYRSTPSYNVSDELIDRICKTVNPRKYEGMIQRISARAEQEGKEGV